MMKDFGFFGKKVIEGRNSAGINQLNTYRDRFLQLYTAGQIEEASVEVVQAIASLYKEPEGFGNLINTPSDDLRFAFRVEHDGCELLRTFIDMIGTGPGFSKQNGISQRNAIQARMNFLRELLKVFPDWRFAINLLALMLLENDYPREALAFARASFNIKENCPFGEYILQRVLRYLVSHGLTQDLVMNNVERALTLNLENFICLQPFSNFAIWRTGDVYVCCGAWVPVSIGNIFEHSWEEIWNSPAAREVRRSVLEGDFKYCSRSCALINNGLLIKRSDLLDRNFDKYHELWGILVYKRAPHVAKQIIKYVKKKQTKMDEGPFFVDIAYDYTCNLVCPSCRSEVKIADSERRKELDIVRDRVIFPLLPHIQELLIAGDGDPFASKHYRSILAALDKKQYPNLHLSILTNGVLFNESEWKRYKNIHGLLYSVSVSIDAATPETYDLIRCGGDWKRLMQNLEFLAKLHNEGMFPYFELNFVVQKENFREMKSFVKLGQRLGVDKVRFVQLHNDFNSFSKDEFMDANIFKPSHPDYMKLVETFNDPIFQNQIVLYPKSVAGPHSSLTVKPQCTL